MSDTIPIDLEEAAGEWANPSAIVVNGTTYAVTVRKEE